MALTRVLLTLSDPRGGALCNGGPFFAVVMHASTWRIRSLFLDFVSRDRIDIYCHAEMDHNRPIYSLKPIKVYNKMLQTRITRLLRFHHTVI